MKLPGLMLSRPECKIQKKLTAALQAVDRKAVSLQYKPVTCCNHIIVHYYLHYNEIAI